jgi:hypothetical protein
MDSHHMQMKRTEWNNSLCDIIHITFVGDSSNYDRIHITSVGDSSNYDLIHICRR